VADTLTARAPETPKVYTFRISGGPEVTLQVRQGPPLHHTGGTTLWKMTGTSKEVEGLATFLCANGSREVQVFCEAQTTEQALFRIGTTGKPGFR
jgi:hypothetical protein